MVSQRSVPALTGFAQKSLQHIIEERDKYRLLSHKWFIDNESGDEYQLIYFAHDDHGDLCVVLNHVRVSQLKRVVTLDNFFKGWQAKDGAYQRYMTHKEVGKADGNSS